MWFQNMKFLPRGTLASSISVKGKDGHGIIHRSRQSWADGRNVLPDLNSTFARQIKLSCALSLSSGLQPHNHWVHAWMGLVMKILRSQNEHEEEVWGLTSLYTPSSSMVTFWMTMKCLRPSLVKLYLGLSFSSQVSLYHETIALSKETSHSKVADCRSLTSTLWIRLVKWICSAKTDKDVNG